MRNGIFPIVSVKQGCHSHATTATMDSKLVRPKGTQEGKNICHVAAIKLQPLPMVSPKETQDVKTQDTAPDN